MEPVFKGATGLRSCLRNPDRQGVRWLHRLRLDNSCLLFFVALSDWCYLYYFVSLWLPQPLLKARAAHLVPWLQPSIRLSALSTTSSASFPLLPQVISGQVGLGLFWIRRTGSSRSLKPTTPARPSKVWGMIAQDTRHLAKSFTV